MAPEHSVHVGVGGGIEILCQDVSVEGTPAKSQKNVPPSLMTGFA